MWEEPRYWQRGQAESDTYELDFPARRAGRPAERWALAPPAGTVQGSPAAPQQPSPRFEKNSGMEFKCPIVRKEGAGINSGA